MIAENIKVEIVKEGYQTNSLLIGTAATIALAVMKTTMKTTSGKDPDLEEAIKSLERISVLRDGGTNCGSTNYDHVSVKIEFSQRK